jgi:hypothetical protein
MQRESIDLEQDLSNEFAPRVGRDTVRRVVIETEEAFSDARIRAFVPLLVRRTARERLRRLSDRVA